MARIVCKDDVRIRLRRDSIGSATSPLKYSTVLHWITTKKVVKQNRLPQIFNLRTLVTCHHYSLLIHYYLLMTCYHLSQIYHHHC